MKEKLHLSELEGRMRRFRQKMFETQPEWEIAVIFGKINLYYFTGTMQDGVLIIPRDSEAVLWVRRSYERALEESSFPKIYPMASYREAAEYYKKLPETVFIEAEVVPFALYQRFNKYFKFTETRPLDRQISAIRSLKSPYELSMIKKAGSIHQKVLEQYLPEMLKEGMSEAELAGELFNRMIKEGHQGVARFSMFETDLVIGHISFGKSSIYPTYFNGPGGSYGMSSAVPNMASHSRKLRKGDLVYVDVGCCVEGYHTDKTITYMFGEQPSKEINDVHKKCVDIQDEISAMLRPGAVPAEIYKKIINNLDEVFLENFMGFGKHKVTFLGHGIGLHIDETPVIAAGFYEPLQEGMVFAIEPKKGIEQVGMVGIENTFLVTKHGGRCITGNSTGLIPVL